MSRSAGRGDVDRLRKTAVHDCDARLCRWPATSFTVAEDVRIAHGLGEGGERVADDELFRRWQVARLTEPLYRLQIRSATKADFNHERYDLIQLALRAIDYVVTRQASMDGTVTPDELVAHLAVLARRLTPGRPRPALGSGGTADPGQPAERRPSPTRGVGRACRPRRVACAPFLQFSPAAAARRRRRTAAVRDRRGGDALPAGARRRLRPKSASSDGLHDQISAVFSFRDC